MSDKERRAYPGVSAFEILDDTISDARPAARSPYMAEFNALEMVISEPSDGGQAAWVADHFIV
ncbi:hypothetical protein [Tateyamaria pelophila]|uniref:hypothetical protein n=1 Tax=Tateyamaria pelophila TaxID=328415 RepID=UPI001CBE8953|nr:hypothetical protein [Tateyamaria pelophila]